MTFCLSSLWNGDETERGSGLARQSIVAILPNAGRRPALPGKRGEDVWLVPMVPCAQPAVVSLHHARRRIGGDTPADAGRGGGLARQSIAAILPNAGRRPALPGKRGKTFGWFRWCLAPSPLSYHCLTFVGALGGDTPADAGRGGGLARQSRAAILTQCGPEACAPRKAGGRRSSMSTTKT